MWHSMPDISDLADRKDDVLIVKPEADLPDGALRPEACDRHLCEGI